MQFSIQIAIVLCLLGSALAQDRASIVARQIDSLMAYIPNYRTTEGYAEGVRTFIELNAEVDNPSDLLSYDTFSIEFDKLRGICREFINQVGTPSNEKDGGKVRICTELTYDPDHSIEILEYAFSSIQKKMG